MLYTVTLNPGIDHTLTVPRIDFDCVLRATQVRRDCGGKGFNVSRALKMLDLESQALGFIGGESGKWEERTLQSLGIATDFDRIGGETRTCVVIREAGRDRHIKVNEPGPCISPAEQVALRDHVSAIAAQGDHWAFSGSLPPGMPEDYYAALIQIVQSKGGLAYLDSSQAALSAGIAASPYLVKPNRQEAEELSGIKILTLVDFQQAAAYFFDFGIQVVALSLGAGGLFLTTPAHCVWVRPPHVDAINAVGPGDALLAGILYATVNHFSLAEIARWGVACGTMAVIKDGVNFGSLEEVHNMVNLIEVVDAH